MAFSFKMRGLLAPMLRMRRLTRRREIALYVGLTTSTAIAFAVGIDLVWTVMTGTMPGWTTLKTVTITLIAVLPLSLDAARTHLRNLNTNRHLRERARRDQQTNLLHHKAFMEEAGRALRLHPYALLLVGDLDRFKQINDRFGHQAGDEVIQHVSKIMTELFGADALVGRLGGEEFAVLITPTGDGTAVPERTDLTQAEAWRQRVDLLRIEHDGRTVPATISIGVARGTPGISLEDLYTRADRALYLAKSAGRNRVAADHDADVLTGAWVIEDEVAWQDDARHEGGREHSAVPNDAIPLSRKSDRSA